MDLEVSKLNGVGTRAASEALHLDACHTSFERQDGERLYQLRLKQGAIPSTSNTNLGTDSGYGSTLNLDRYARHLESTPRDIGHSADQPDRSILL